MPIAPDGVLPPSIASENGEAVQRPARIEQEDRRALHLLEVRRDRLAVDLDAVRAKVDRHPLAVHVDEVLQASSGMSSHTTSTCAVCGNMSYARSELTR